MVTLRELRQLVGVKTGDVLVLTASATSANGSSFCDFAHLMGREDRAPSLVNKLLYFSAGTTANVGHEAAITDFTSDTRTLSFNPDAPAIPQQGDVAELWSVAERIGSIAALHLLINYAIDAVKNIAGPEEYAEPQTFDARVGSLTIPAIWSEFGGADFIDRSNFRDELRSKHLKVQPGLRTVRIRDAGAEWAHRRPVYLYGYVRCTPLVNETDNTPVNTQWIVESVAEALTLGRSWASADPAAAERRAGFWSARADLYRRSVASGRRGLGIALPT